MSGADAPDHAGHERLRPAAEDFANPLPVIVPCRHMVGADGNLTGSTGGLWRKRFLLDPEEPAGARADRLF